MNAVNVAVASLLELRIDHTSHMVARMETSIATLLVNIEEATQKLEALRCEHLAATELAQTQPAAHRFEHEVRMKVVTDIYITRSAYRRGLLRTLRQTRERRNDYASQLAAAQAMMNSLFQAA